MRKLIIFLGVLAVAAAGTYFFFFKQVTGVDSAEDAEALIGQFAAGADAQFAAQGMNMRSSTTTDDAPNEDGKYIVYSSHQLDINSDGFDDDTPVVLRHEVSDSLAETLIVTRLADQDLRTELLGITNNQEPLEVTTRIKPTKAVFDGKFAAIDVAEEDMTAQVAPLRVSGHVAVNKKYAFEIEGGAGKLSTTSQMDPEMLAELQELGELEGFEEFAELSGEPQTSSLSYSGIAGEGTGTYLRDGVSVGEAMIGIFDVAFVDDGLNLSASELTLQADAEQKSAGIVSDIVMKVSDVQLPEELTAQYGTMDDLKITFGYGPLPIDSLVAFQKTVSTMQEDTDPAVIGDAAARLLSSLEAPLGLGFGFEASGDAPPASLQLNATLDPPGDVTADMLLPIVMGQTKINAAFQADLRELMDTQPEMAAMMMSSGMLEQVNGTVYRAKADYQGGMLSLNGSAPMPAMQLFGALMGGQ